MQKISLFAILLWIVPALLSAQTQSPFCATDALLQEALRDENLRIRHNDIEQQIYQYFKRGERPRAGAKLQVQTLPVVVHIVHQNGPENISDALVQTGIQQLNEAFANTAYYDQGTGYNTMIQFCLAKRTPDNLASNGITRNQNALTEMDLGTQDIALKNLNRWDPKSYINIWVVKEICGGGTGCGVAGYAYLPAAHGKNYDGIVMEARWLGSTPGNTGVLVHEMGHYLGLYHTFQGGCQNDDCLADGDKVCDTPPDQSTLWVPCGAVVNTCNTDAQSGFSSDQNDMILNFMDYTDFDCFHDFTQGQSERMNWHIDMVRGSLLESKGCATPCLNPVSAAFSASSTDVMPGVPVVFSNSSGNADLYEWKVNGTVFSTAANPVYTFTQTGNFLIEMTAFSADPDHCSPASAAVQIRVSCPVEADFSVSNKFPVVGETVTLSNQSQNATFYSWFLDGVPQGASFSNFTPQTAGLHIVRLDAGNGVCQSSRYEYIVAQSNTPQDNCEKYWLKTYGSPAFNENSGNLIPAFDGSFYLSGYRNDSTIIMSVSPDGVVLWSRLFRFSTHSQEQITYFFEDSDHNLVGCGMSTDGNIFIGFTFKYNPANDQIIWSFENPPNPQTYNFTMVEKSPGGNYLIFNSYHDSPSPGSFDDLHWVEINRNTGLFTNTKYGFSFGTSEGALEAQVRNGRVYTCGRYTYGTWYDGFRGGISCFDLQANEIWSMMPLYPSNVSARNYATDFTFDGDNMVTVYFGDFSGEESATDEFALSKTDLSGNMLWSKRYTIPGASRVFPRTVANTTDGYIVMAYEIQVNRTWLIKVDKSGNVVWAWLYKDFYGLRGEKTLIVRGDALYLTATYGNDIALMKADAATGFVAGACTPPEAVNLAAATIPNFREYITLVRYASPITQNVRQTKPSVQTLAATAQCSVPCPSEICNNGQDDDGDGLADCFDPDCNCKACDGQQSRFWYFGSGAGLDFGTDPPTVLSDGQTFSREASAVATDPFGNLLFYTDGQKVYNRNHQVMPNGTGLGGHPSTTQMLILPQPGKPWRFYVFTPNSFDNLGSGFGTTYSVVDMTLQGGLGDVIPAERNLVLVAQSLFTEKVTATRHCNGIDWWVLIKENNQRFRSYLLNSNGLQAPVISTVGTPASPNTNLIGCMKFSVTGAKLVNTLSNTGGFDLMDFDLSTGILSNAVTVANSGLFPLAYGVEFSGDGKLLYMSNLTGTSKLTQFDLTLPPAQMLSNRTTLATGANIYRYGQIQRASNGKIYVNNAAPFVFAPSLGVINQPEVKGTGCFYQEEALPLAPGGANIGLPSFPQDFFPKKLHPKIVGPDSMCVINQPTPYYLQLDACTVDSVLWRVSGGSLFVQNNQAVTAVFDQPGTYTITALVFSPCVVAADTFTVFVDSSGAYALNLGPDVALCENGVRVLDAGPGFAQYRWSDGSEQQTLTTLFPGTYWVDVWDNCGNQQSDTIVISVLPATVLNLGPDTVTCSALTYTLPPAFQSWTWSPATGLNCTNCSPVTVSLNGTMTYTVIAQTADGCLSADTLNISSGLLADTLIVPYCPGDTLLLGGQIVTPTGDTSLVFTVPGSGACDTLRTYVLDEQPLPTVNATLFLCPGDTLYIGGVPYSSPGFVQDTVPAAVGCDTIFNYILRFAPIPTRTDTIGLCPGDTVYVQGQPYSSPTTFILTIPATTGCDTLATYVIIDVAPPTQIRNIAFCPGTSVNIDGVAYSQPDTVQSIVPASTGCDTVLTYILEFAPQPTGAQTILFCPGDTVFIGGQAFTQPGTTTGTVPATTGCDTLTTYTLAYAPQPTSVKTIEFCPGDTVYIAGTPYTQPGTATGLIPAATGCDTLATYHLQYSSAGFNSVMNISCPNDLYVDVPSGDSSALVNYAAPGASTDCICPGVSVMLQQGLPSGSAFPLGSTDVCYTAADSCGSHITCCFKVTVKEQDACDVKVINCVKYELIGISQNAAGQKTYRIRVTNNCAQKMIYFAAQVPDGLTADAPLNNSNYEAPSGRDYLVRNPNYSPFYGIRFGSTTDSIANGQFDVFQYTLPPQADPTFIHVMVRLKDQIYHEAHLNTFYCPVTMESANKTAGKYRSDDDLFLYPNPTDGALYLDATAWPATGVQLRVLDAQGKMFVEQRVENTEQTTLIRLPQHTASGLYILDVRADDGRRWAKRFVVRK